MTWTRCGDDAVDANVRDTKPGITSLDVPSKMRGATWTMGDEGGAQETGRWSGGEGEVKAVNTAALEHADYDAWAFLSDCIWPGDLDEQAARMTKAAEVLGGLTEEQAHCHKPAAEELRTFWWIVRAAALHSEKGMQLFLKFATAAARKWAGSRDPANFGQYMRARRFLYLRKWCVYSFATDEELTFQKNNPGKSTWAQVEAMFDQLGEERKEMFAGAARRGEEIRTILDEMMIAWRPKTSQLGGLPNITFEPRKPKNLGTMLKDGRDTQTGLHRHVEIVKAAGTEGLAHMEDESCLGDAMGATQSCVLRHTTKHDVGAHLLGDSWFAGVRSAVEMKSKYGCDWTGIVKVNKMGFPYKALLEASLNLGRGKWVAFTAEVDGVTLYALAYKYSLSSPPNLVLSTCGTTVCTRPYTSSYSDENGTRHVASHRRPDMISDYFDGSTIIDDKNKERQAHLAVEDAWPTKDCYFKIMCAMAGSHVVDMKGMCAHFDVWGKGSVKRMTSMDFLDRVVGVLLPKERVGRRTTDTMVAGGVQYTLKRTDMQQVGTGESRVDGRKRKRPSGRCLECKERKVAKLKKAGRTNMAITRMMKQGLITPVMSAWYCTACGPTQRGGKVCHMLTKRDCFARHIRRHHGNMKDAFKVVEVPGMVQPDSDGAVGEGEVTRDDDAADHGVVSEEEEEEEEQQEEDEWEEEEQQQDNGGGRWAANRNLREPTEEVREPYQDSSGGLHSRAERGAAVDPYDFDGGDLDQRTSNKFDGLGEEDLFADDNLFAADGGSESEEYETGEPISAGLGDLNEAASRMVAAHEARQAGRQFEDQISDTCSLSSLPSVGAVGDHE